VNLTTDPDFTIAVGVLLFFEDDDAGLHAHPPSESSHENSFFLI
jgi:hypothetical protein